VVVAGFGTGYVATAVSITGTSGQVASIFDVRRLISHDMGYLLVDGPGSAGNVNVFAATNATFFSQSDIVQLYLYGTVDQFVLADLGAQAPAISQSANVLDMVVDFLPTGTSTRVHNFYTLNNHGHLNSTGYFSTIRTRGWSGPVPDQTIPNLGNVFRQVAILTDVEQGGQTLVATRSFLTNTTVGDIDAVLFWQGTVASQITLPLASLYKGRQILVKKASLTPTNTAPLLILTLPGNFIDAGRTEVTLLNVNSFLQVTSDGATHWFVTGFGVAPP
jgi:hypothetical protein